MCRSVIIYIYLYACDVHIVCYVCCLHNYCSLIVAKGRRALRMLRPSPTGCFDLLAQYIPELAMSRNAELSSEIQAANDRLKEYPNNVDEYVEQLGKQSTLSLV